MKTLNKTTKTFYDVKTTWGLAKAVLDIETEENSKGELVLSISGALYDKYKSINKYKRNASAFGQVDMDIVYEEASDDLKRILDIWKKYHLNDMHPECVHQEEAGIRKLLGQECPVCGYKYGHGWTYRPIPEEILTELGLK